MAGKGSSRRPRFIPLAELDAAWTRTFGKPAFALGRTTIHGTPTPVSTEWSHATVDFGSPSPRADAEAS